MNGREKMKVTFDLPDNFRCAFLNYVYQDGVSMMIGCKLLDSRDLKDGAEIKIEPKEPDQN